MRITSDGDTGRLGASIMPIPAKLAQAFQSWGGVSGNPGTDAIEAPYPASVPQGVRYRNDGAALHSSSDAAPAWNPGVYYQREIASRFAGAIESDNQLPVPARTPSGLPAYMARKPVFLRQNQVGWPLALPSYAWRG